MTEKAMRLLIAASGTGGHLFPALAVAQQLPDCPIEWLGVPNRLETTLVPKTYPLHTVPVEGFQTRLSLKTLKILWGLMASVFRVRKLLKERQIDLVFTTGGYIAAPAILAARWRGIPVILHESNFIPGKVTRLLSPLCSAVALGFEGTATYLPRIPTLWTSTPVRDRFRSPQPLELPIAKDIPLIAIAGGSQGAVALNQLVRQCALTWLEAGAAIVHLTGENDPEADSLQHPRYFSMPFYDNMAGLFQRANLAISRAGAGTLTELAITRTPAILIPYPYAAEDHQTYNAKVFAEAGAAYVYPQKELSADELGDRVLQLIQAPERLQQMADNMATLAIENSAEQLAALAIELWQRSQEKRGN